MGGLKIGKSSFINKLFGDLEHEFKTSSILGIPCTNGVKALKKPIQLNEFNILLFDCQGFGIFDSSSGDEAAVEKSRRDDILMLLFMSIASDTIIYYMYLIYLPFPIKFS